MSGQGGGYRDHNSTADRTLEILRLFSETRLSLSAAEVAAELGVARSTAYRYLQSLMSSGLIEERQGGGYALGLRVLELARLARRGTVLPEVALPVMRRLRDELGETVLLTRRIGEQVICVEREETLARVRISYAAGTVLPLHSGASATVLIAWLPPDEARAMLEAAPLERFTPKTLVDPDRLVERLAEIRERGYAVSQGELDQGVVGIAFPVHDARGDVFCALGVAAFERRLTRARLGGAIDSVRRAARALEESLRFHLV
jgi:DNA-binding IclR family transcriptional regulator